MTPSELQPDPAADSPPSTGPTLVLGVLGGIASGKSTVARLLARACGEVVDADELAHRALEEPAVLEHVRARFGQGAVAPDGRPDRSAIARRAFESEEDRRALEGWIHPLVRARIGELLAAARAQSVARVVLDVPLLLENEAQHGLASLCDALVFVDAGAAERERRAMRGRGWARGEMARREASQMPLTEKRARSQYVIANNGDPRELEAAVTSLLERMEATRTGR